MHVSVYTFTRSSLQAGLIERWKDNAMDGVRRESRKQRRMLATDDEETTVTAENIIKPLTMVHMQGPFLLYLACIIVSFAAFLGELARSPFLRGNQQDSVLLQLHSSRVLITYKYLVKVQVKIIVFISCLLIAPLL